jgi:hypothetical protein
MHGAEPEAPASVPFKWASGIPEPDADGFIRVTPVNQQTVPDAPGVNDDPMQAEREHYRRVMLNPLISGVEDDDGA